MGQIDLFENYLYPIGLCVKKRILDEQLHKKCKYEHTMNMIP